MALAQQVKVLQSYNNSGQEKRILFKCKSRPEIGGPITQDERQAHTKISHLPRQVSKRDL
jgi:hypothetical protein